MASGQMRTLNHFYSFQQLSGNSSETPNQTGKAVPSSTQPLVAPASGANDNDEDEDDSDDDYADDLIARMENLGNPELK